MNKISKTLLKFGITFRGKGSQPKEQSGRDPPAALTPDMVPPSMRPKGQDAVSQNYTSS